MEPPQPNINIKLEIGVLEQPLLANATIQFVSKSQNVHQLRNKLKINQSDLSKFNIQIAFKCKSGKQQECIKYLQKGLQDKKNKSKQELSPIQNLIRVPKENVCTLKMIPSPSKVTIIYQFIEQLADFDQMLNTFQSEGCNLNFTSSLLLHGHQVHNHQNRTNVKVNYCLFRFISDKIYGKQFFNAFIVLLEENSSQIQPLRFISNTKKLHLDIKTQPYRQILNYVQRATHQNKQVKHTNKKFNYFPPDLFQQEVQIVLFYGDKIGVHAKIHYQSEEVFFRLTKVYKTFIDRIF